jgi:hypothetical protein
MAPLSELPLGSRRLRGVPQRSQLPGALAVSAEQSSDAAQLAVPALRDPVVNGHSKPVEPAGLDRGSDFGEGVVGQRALTNRVRLLGAEPKQSQDAFGDSVGGPCVVAIRVVTQQFSEP